MLVQKNKLTWKHALMSDDLYGQVDDFLRAAQDQAKGYASDHIIMTMGEDFNYQSGDMWYKNLDKLIWYDAWVHEPFAEQWMIGHGTFLAVFTVAAPYLDSALDLGMFFSTCPVLSLFWYYMLELFLNF